MLISHFASPSGGFVPQTPWPGSPPCESPPL